MANISLLRVPTVKDVSRFVATVALAFLLDVPFAGAATETVVHSFQNDGRDGLFPHAGLIRLNGKLYGTTYKGGDGGCDQGCGTIFSIDLSTHAKKILHSFANDGDGQNPEAALLNVNGTMYGTTQGGGAWGRGTVYSIQPKTGAESVLYSFNSTDGFWPRASLINVGGILFGTTYWGGRYGYGSVFSIDPTNGAETVVYSFGTGADGQNPFARLLDLHGTLYGTTQYNGAWGYGTVFSVDPNTGTEKVVYSFQTNGPDGAWPQAPLIYTNGKLYGTTTYGGIAGAIFALKPSTGAETIVHSFQNDHADGFFPYAGLIKVNGILYGTTYEGGTGSCSQGCGTVFAYDLTTGAETVLYSFAGGADGQNPQADLISLNGTLYGTTAYGGNGSCPNGCGTVFSITP